MSIEDQHKKWLYKIRTHVWKEVQYEFDLPLSNYTGYEQYGYQTCGLKQVVTKLQSSHLHNMDGFKRQIMGVTVFSTTPMNMYLSLDKVSKFTPGCKCKSGCRTKRCGCRKNGQQCGPGCQCLNWEFTYLRCCSAGIQQWPWNSLRIRSQEWPWMWKFEWKWSNESDTENEISGTESESDTDQECCVNAYNHSTV